MKQPKIKRLNYKQIHTAVLELYIRLSESKYIPDIIMPIARGGLVPAGILSQYYPDAKFYLIQTKSYKDVDKQEESVRIYIPKSISKDIEKNQKILIVDDIYDTGKTLEEVKNVLMEKGIKNNVATCTLFLREESEGSPDFFAETIKQGVWLNFPWELKIIVGKLQSIKDNKTHVGRIYKEMV